MGRDLRVFVLRQNVLREQLPWARVRAMLDHAVTLSPGEPGSDEFVPRSRIQVNLPFIAAPTFLYAFCDRLRIALEFGCSFGSFLSHLVRVRLVIVRTASQQAQPG